jgi:type VI secretion system protein ImpA
MASPPLLDFETLLAPIPGADPAGETLPFDLRKKLEDLRKEVNPNQFAEDDPRRPEQPQAADWPGIEQLAKDTLARTSKDLFVAVRLTEALVKLHGFGGLRDGLRLIRRMANECWDRVHPVIRDGDTEARLAVFNWLDDDFKGARFPFTLRMLPLTNAKDKNNSKVEPNFGCQAWRNAEDPHYRGAVIAKPMLEQAVAATRREDCQTIVDVIAESANELTELTKVLKTKMGEAAPGLGQVRKALDECQDLAQHILKRKGPAPVPVQELAAQPDESGVAAQPPTANGTRQPLTREDVLDQLAEASGSLLQMEPHSPIAYMIQRAVKLARLPLPELMRVLVRDPGVLSQLDRDLDLGLELHDTAKPGKGK